MRTLFAVVFILQVIERTSAENCDIRKWYMKLTSAGVFSGKLTADQIQIKEMIDELLKASKKDPSAITVECDILDLYADMFLAETQKRDMSNNGEETVVNLDNDNGIQSEITQGPGKILDKRSTDESGDAKQQIKHSVNTNFDSEPNKIEEVTENVNDVEETQTYKIDELTEVNEQTHPNNNAYQRVNEDEELVTEIELPPEETRTIVVKQNTNTVDSEVMEETDVMKETEIKDTQIKDDKAFSTIKVGDIHSKDDENETKQNKISSKIRNITTRGSASKHCFTPMTFHSQYCHVLEPLHCPQINFHLHMRKLSRIHINESKLKETNTSQKEHSISKITTCENSFQNIHVCSPIQHLMQFKMSTATSESTHRIPITTDTTIDNHSQNMSKQRRGKDAKEPNSIEKSSEATHGNSAKENNTQERHKADIKSRKLGSKDNKPGKEVNDKSGRMDRHADNAKKHPKKDPRREKQQMASKQAKRAKHRRTLQRLAVAAEKRKYKEKVVIENGVGAEGNVKPPKKGGIDESGTKNAKIRRDNVEISSSSETIASKTKYQEKFDIETDMGKSEEEIQKKQHMTTDEEVNTHREKVSSDSNDIQRDVSKDQKHSTNYKHSRSDSTVSERPIGKNNHEKELENDHSSKNTNLHEENDNIDKIHSTNKHSDPNLGKDTDSIIIAEKDKSTAKPTEESNIDVNHSNTDNGEESARKSEKEKELLKNINDSSEIEADDVSASNKASSSEAQNEKFTDNSSEIENETGQLSKPKVDIKNRKTSSEESSNGNDEENVDISYLNERSTDDKPDDGLSVKSFRSEEETKQLTDIADDSNIENSPSNENKQKDGLTVTIETSMNEEIRNDDLLHSEREHRSDSFSQFDYKPKLATDGLTQESELPSIKEHGNFKGKGFPSQTTLSKDNVQQKDERDSSIEKDKMESSFDSKNVHSFENHFNLKSEAYAMKMQQLELMVMKLENQILLDQLHDHNHTSTILKMENHILQLENELIKLNTSYNELKAEQNSIKKNKSFLELPYNSPKSSMTMKHNAETISEHQEKITFLSQALRNQTSLIERLKSRSDYLEDQNRLLFQMLMNQTALISQIMTRVQELTEQTMRQRGESQILMQKLAQTTHLKEKKVKHNNLPGKMEKLVTDFSFNHNTFDAEEISNPEETTPQSSSENKVQIYRISNLMDCRQINSTKCLYVALLQTECTPFQSIVWVKCKGQNEEMVISDYYRQKTQNQESQQIKTLHNNAKEGTKSENVNQADVRKSEANEHDFAKTQNDDELDNEDKQTAHRGEINYDSQNQNDDKLTRTTNDKADDTSNQRGKEDMKNPSSDTKNIPKTNNNEKQSSEDKIQPDKQNTPLEGKQKSVENPGAGQGRPPIIFKSQGREEPKDCYDHYKKGITRNGVFKIRPYGLQSYVQVYCDMKNGGWTVFQSRQDGTTKFLREWDDYKAGFGGIHVEHWLGNDNLHYITNQDYYSLRIDLMDWEKDSKVAYYDYFMVEDEEHGYMLHVDGYHGDAGDGMSKHHQNKFSTTDVDNDKVVKEFGGSCAKRFSGAWWYYKCYMSNLNGRYYRNGEIPEKQYDGITWKPWTGPNYSLRRVEMKIRPASADIPST